jgi:hypothetical protein
MLLEQVDDCEELSKFLSSEKWTIFQLEKFIWILLPNIQKELLL